MLVRLQPRQVAALAHDAGFRDDDLFVAVAVIEAESHSQPAFKQDNPDGTRCSGLLGLTLDKSLLGSTFETSLYDPAQNLVTGFAYWQEHGWDAWASVKQGTWLSDTCRARALLGVSNRWDEMSDGLARKAGISPVLRVPWISTHDLQRFYPNLVL